MSKGVSNWSKEQGGKCRYLRIRFSIEFDLARPDEDFFCRKMHWLDHVMFRGKRPVELKTTLRDSETLNHGTWRKGDFGELLDLQWLTGPSALLKRDNWFDVHLSD